MIFLNEDDFKKLPFSPKPLLSTAPTTEQLRNIRVACDIPQTDKIIGIIDTTIFNSGKNGIVFTDKKIYNKSLWEDPFSLTWETFASCSLKKGKLTVYTQIDNCEYEFSNGVDIDQLYTILCWIQETVSQKITLSDNNKNDSCSHELDESTIAKKSKTSSDDETGIYINLEELKNISHGYINLNPKDHQLVNIRKACKIPDSEKIHGIIDTSLFDLGKTGIAFTEKAIYVKAILEEPFNFSWQNIINYEIIQGITCVYITVGSSDYEFDTDDVPKAQLVNILRSLQSLIREKIKKKVINEKNDKNKPRPKVNLSKHYSIKYGNINKYEVPQKADNVSLESDITTFVETDILTKTASINPESLNTRYCISCGTLLASNMSFCPECGSECKDNRELQTIPPVPEVPSENENLPPETLDNSEKEQSKYEVSEFVLSQQQLKARFWNKNMNTQIITGILLIFLGILYCVYLFFAAGNLYNTFVGHILTAADAYLTNNAKFDFTNTDEFIKSLKVFNETGWQDLKNHFVALREGIVLNFKIIISTPFVLYSAITLWAFSISIGASGIFKKLDLSYHKTMVNRTMFISFLGVAGGVSGVIAIFHPISIYWNSLLLFISLNLIILSGNWLMLRFFSVKRALKKVSLGDVPSKPWSWYLWLSNICILPCLLTIDAVIFPVYYYFY